jgi:hypothetical protein
MERNKMQLTVRKELTVRNIMPQKVPIPKRWRMPHPGRT